MNTQPSTSQDTAGQSPDSPSAKDGLSLNGSKTKPLTDHAKGVLRDLLRKPIPMKEINPGVRYRLQRGGWVREIQYTSPYAKHRGGTCPHLALNSAGQEFAKTL